jgi:hypothetical protein
LSNANGNGIEDYDDNYGLTDEHDDDYYFDRGQVPLWFRYHDIVLRERREKALGRELDVDEFHHSITQDQLDLILKMELRISSEQRYQREKQNYYFHELYIEGRRECNPALGGCTPNCRFYHEYGRIEDEEVIEKHNKFVESHQQKNAIVELP